MKILKPKELKWEKSQTLMTNFFFSKKQKNGVFFLIYLFTEVRFKNIRKFYEVRLDMGATYGLCEMP